MTTVNTGNADHKDLLIPQGTDWSDGWLVTWQGDPIDGTWSARSQIRHKVTASVVLHEFAADVTAEGAVVIAVSDTESSAWNWTEGVYDVETVGPGGFPVLRVAQGKVVVDREVTR